MLALLADAAAWLHSQGIDQWPRDGFPASRITPLIAEGVFFVLLSDDLTGPAATVALDGYADPEFWHPGDLPENALYVHKLAVNRACSGLGIGEALLDWAGGRVLMSGRRWLRLDCSKKNKRLQRYYLKLQFRHVRTVDLPHRASGALFQRSGTVRLNPEGLYILDETREAPVPA
ncbi:GNAT family N-acetyltransferase [Bailinhaonella thermotolerans]|uniref:GNAT family N-acetyltransferase n=1 Tax=Bailinhaonella thermotolerans TaxID=1070861 RepID=UPI00192A648A|nr:GNAT family N-acetyltransferase [Bailinhaonella thermotolerans]